MKPKILSDVVCSCCARRIGWHDQYYGCPGFSYDYADLKKLVDEWFAENEPEIGFRNDSDIPFSVLTAIAALAMCEVKVVYQGAAAPAAHLRVRVPGPIAPYTGELKWTRMKR